MAPLDPNTTARIWVDYTARNVEHSVLLRYRAPQTPIAVLDWFASILGFIQAYLPTSWAIQGARHASAGVDVSVPIDISSSELNGFTGGDTNASNYNSTYDPRQITWVGRSNTTGRRVRLGLYGYQPVTPTNYRWGPGETPASSSSVIAALNAGSAAGAFITIDGSSAVFKPYVNVNFNSYWESRARKG